MLSTRDYDLRIPATEVDMTHEESPLPFAPGRRLALQALAAAVLLPAAPAIAQSAGLMPTPSQPEGPFYPRTFPMDRDADLTQIAGHAARASGTPLYFSGRVLARDGSPLVGTSIELWQCDAHGRYHHAGDAGIPRDDNFQGYGTATTDGEGRYAFKAIRPVPHSGRTPHLHVRVRPAGRPSLTTQIYIAGDNADGDFVLAASPVGVREQLMMEIMPAGAREPGAMAGTFDFVMG
jgi:protocatechuate 3,4-dioxygenase, beta subunit